VDLMGEIRIGPGVLAVLLLAVLGIAGAALASELPDLKRYMKIKQM
jgi:hypothetical protein